MQCMRYSKIFLVIIFSSLSIPDFIIGFSVPNINDKIKEDIFNIYEKTVLYVRDNIQKVPVTEEDITFLMFSKESPDYGTQLDVKNDLELLRDSSPVIFIVHGWQAHVNVSPHLDLKDAFLHKNSDSKIVLVDCKPLRQDYVTASVSTHDVAQHIANLILDLNENYGVLEENILLVGHSLGGHTMGFVGKIFQNKTGKKLSRIVGLDPAGPLFIPRPVDQRLNPSDAEVVQVIHSNGGFLGYKDPIGTIDFFVNGGSEQPGCGKIELNDPTKMTKSFSDAVGCNHQRCYHCFIEAVMNPTEFISQKCQSWTKFSKKQCNQSEKVAMGDMSSKSTGNFYLETNDKPPFSPVV